MTSLPVVILQSNLEMAQKLAAELASQRTTMIAESVDDLRGRIAKHRAESIVLDMEAASVSELEALARDFPAVRIVCNHRLADDELWTVTVGAGAADCCASSDIESIRMAVTQSRAQSHAA